MTHDELITTMKAQLWEEAKGKLRALVAVSGSVSAHGADPSDQRAKWRKLDDLVKALIGTVEDLGLHE